MPSPEREIGSIGIIGGTGPEGRGLGARFAMLGLPVNIGSRSSERGAEIAAQLAQSSGGAVWGGSNEDAAARGEAVILTIPYAGVDGTVPPLLDALSGKIVISAIAPIEFREGRPHALRPVAGSAAQEVAALLPESRVVSAFQTIDAHMLGDVDHDLDTDVLVCSDDVEARREVLALAGRLPGVRALSAGRLAASRYLEECTALLITLNRIYKVHSGIRISGIQR